MCVFPDELADGLVSLGLKSKDYVMVHSSLSSFGHLVGGAETFIDVLQKIITYEGLIMMPAFTYGREPFDRNYTCSDTGKVAEVFRTMKNVVRSEHPTHSVCVWGNRSNELVDGHKTESAFCIGSPMYKLLANGGKVLLVGVDYTSCSMIHVAQELADVDYLDRPKMVEILDDNGIIRSFKARRAGCSLGFNNVIPYVDYNHVKCVRVGNCLIKLLRAEKIVGAAEKALNNDQASLLCGNPNCVSCNQAKEIMNEKH